MKRGKAISPEAMDVFLDVSKTRLLAPFFGGAYTVAEVAELTGVGASALGYWIKRFAEWGFLEKVPESRPTRYRAVSQEYILDPMHEMPFEELVERRERSSWARLISGYAREYGRIAEDWYLRLYVDENELLHQDFVPAWWFQEQNYPMPELPLNEWGVIRLNREKARELRAVLERTVLEFFEQATEDAEDEVYVFHLGLVRDARPE